MATKYEMSIKPTIDELSWKRDILSEWGKKSLFIWVYMAEETQERGQNTTAGEHIQLTLNSCKMEYICIKHLLCIRSWCKD